MELNNTPGTLDYGPVEILGMPLWQMSFGERSAFEGLLSQVKPKLAIEIGTAQGGSLDRIAEHSEEVHSFDLVKPNPEAEALSNVTFHTGDSHVLLPQVLRQFAEEGRNVDFVLVDGDHSTEGVRADIEDLLDSPATANTVIIMHDTANEVVRKGIEEVEIAAWPKVSYVELDLVAGYVFATPELRYELWGGLGLIVTNDTGVRRTHDVVQNRYYPSAHVLRRGRDLLMAGDGIGNERPVPERLRAVHETGLYAQAVQGREAAELALAEERAAHNQLRHVYGLSMSSISWKITAPLRLLKDRIRNR
ncbi:MAG: class I SAM-dependent methyltransferase [Thermoleophilaceae bacterium]|nr:class I SAM-dependent methyltransferase [Thermoleophilaceae bacterium]